MTNWTLLHLRNIISIRFFKICSTGHIPPSLRFYNQQTHYTSLCMKDEDGVYSPERVLFLAHPCIGWMKAGRGGGQSRMRGVYICRRCSFRLEWVTKHSLSRQVHRGRIACCRLNFFRCSLVIGYHRMAECRPQASASEHRTYVSF